MQFRNSRSHQPHRHRYKPVPPSLIPPFAAQASSPLVVPSNSKPLSPSPSGVVLTRAGRHRHRSWHWDRHWFWDGDWLRDGYRLRLWCWHGHRDRDRFRLGFRRWDRNRDGHRDRLGLRLRLWHRHWHGVWDRDRLRDRRRDGDRDDNWRCGRRSGCGYHHCCC